MLGNQQHSPDNLRLMELSLLARLDARDRALYTRWTLRADSVGVAGRSLWRAVTALGGAAVTIALSLGPALLGDGPRQIAGQTSLLILVSSHLLVQVVKRSVGRPRPSAGLSCEALIAEPDRFSFPSGHAAAVTSLAIGYGFAWPSVAPALGALAMLVGFSRVALGVHYPGDVLAGHLLALVAAALTSA
jgi:undecaprenyl-diphosphatase